MLENSIHSLHPDLTLHCEQTDSAVSLYLKGVPELFTSGGMEYNLAKWSQKIKRIDMFGIKISGIRCTLKA